MSETSRTPNVRDLPMMPAYAQPILTIVADPSTNRTLAIYGKPETGCAWPGRVVGEAQGQGPEAIAEAARLGGLFLAGIFS